jgi:biotin carboxyl carrier protein
LSDLQRQLLAEVTATEEPDHALSRIMHLVLRGATAEALVLFRRGARGQLADGPRLHRKWLALDEPLMRQLAESGRQACLENRAEVRQLDQPCSLTAVAVPVSLRESEGEALCAVVRRGESLNYSVAVLHLASAYLSLWHLRRDSTRTEWEAANAAALVEIVTRLLVCDNLPRACQQLAQDMQQYLRCQRVAVGLKSGNAWHCRLQAISGLAEFDRRSDLVRQVEAAMQEALVRDQLTSWPAPAGQHQATLAHKKLARLVDQAAIVSVPLRDVRGRVVGAWLLTGDEELATDVKRHHMIQASTPHVASCLQLVQRSERGPVSRLARRLWGPRRSWRLAAFIVTVVALGSLLLPCPYRVACNVRLEPVSRRYVAAPFAGTVRRTVCEPGQVVTRHQTLAHLDGREIRWELAGLLAEHQRADKQRQVALASHDTAAAQQAELRMQRLALRIQLLEHRSENLEVRSPIDGVLLRGDLKDAVGVPVTTGQTLFEVAPLNQMLAEIAIPDEEIHHLTEGSTVTIQLDAEPGRERTATLDSIHPLAEVVDGQNVFLGEAPLDNSDNRLRPGMAGRATLHGPRRPLAWNLFHKPWYFLLQRLGI